MNRVLVIVASGLALAGCTSGGMNMDWFPKFEPVPVNIQFESTPPGAEAKTSTGQSCQTPCTLSMPPDKEFSVTFTLANYQPQTVPLTLTKPEGTETALQPNPVTVELVAVPKAPPKRKPRRAATTASAPKPAAAKPAAPRPAATAPAPATTAPATDPWPQVR